MRGMRSIWMRNFRSPVDLNTWQYRSLGDVTGAFIMEFEDPNRLD